MMILCRVPSAAYIAVSSWSRSRSSAHLRSASANRTFRACSTRSSRTDELGPQLLRRAGRSGGVHDLLFQILQLGAAELIQGVVDLGRVRAAERLIQREIQAAPVSPAGRRAARGAVR